MIMEYTSQEIIRNDILLKPTSTVCITGPSKCGKTYFVTDLLKKRQYMYQNGDYPKRILFCYAVQQPVYEELRNEVDNIQFHEGLPNIQTINQFSDEHHNLIILDDMMKEAVNDRSIEKLFTIGSHHHKLSVYFISQNLFEGGKHARTISLNTEYYIIFKNPRDGGQLSTLARQIGAQFSHAIVEAYKDITRRTPYGYLFLDMTQNCSEDMRIRTRIFPNEHTIIYRGKSY